MVGLNNSFFNCIFRITWVTHLKLNKIIQKNIIKKNKFQFFTIKRKVFNKRPKSVLKPRANNGTINRCNDNGC